MIKADELEARIEEFGKFMDAFGFQGSLGAGKRMLHYLGVEEEVSDVVIARLTHPKIAGAWLYGFSFALWYVNTKEGVMLKGRELDG